MSNVNRDKLSERIRKVRKDRKLTQAEVCKRAKINPKTLIDWEKGHCNPRLEELCELCNVLNCSPDYLLNGIDHETYEHKYLNDMTGLTDNAINKIIEIRNLGKIGDKYYSKAPVMSALNDFIESPYFTDLLFNIVKLKNDLPENINDSTTVNYMVFNVQEIFRKLLDDVTNYDEIKKSTRKVKRRRLF